MSCRTASANSSKAFFSLSGSTVNGFAIVGQSSFELIILMVDRLVVLRKVGRNGLSRSPQKVLYASLVGF